MNAAPTKTGPLTDIDDWEEVIQARYGNNSLDETNLVKTKEEFRDYEKNARPSVREFYRLNHMYQTLDFVLSKRSEYLPKQRRRMGVWEAMEFLNTLVDDSDPDVDFSQIEHLMQVAEAIRKDGHPRWFILTGLVHDLGKILCLFGEPQWAVVGDTFPVGCKYSPAVVFPEFFGLNPDSLVAKYQTETGVYDEGCGLDKVHLSWGHDEYLYQVVKEYFPEPALYMIRFHSFYACHKENAYQHLMNDHDRELFKWVRAFNPYDLYSKGLERPDVQVLRPYYEDLISEFFPQVIDW